MKSGTSKWIAKAEHDLVVVETLLRRRVPAVNDSICYHAQQCAEKYLKGYLCELGIRFERTHNLLALLDQVVTVEGEWELLRPNLVELNQFAVAFRYPGRDADRSLARRAHKFCLAVRDAFRQRLRLRVGRRPTKRTRRRSTTGRRARRARWGRNR